MKEMMGMPESMVQMRGMRGIRVEMRGIGVGMRGIRVGMRGIGVGMRGIRVGMLGMWGNKVGVPGTESGNEEKKGEIFCTGVELLNYN